jgi:outer membrane receptor for ferrienterochelin and colicins
MSSAGLMFIPGVWMKAINISKGTGSVVDGYESITGSIDVEMQSSKEDDEALFLNFYGDSDKRLEGNLNLRHSLTENISFITLLHSSRRNHTSDFNNDSFMDIPNMETYNIMQRWNFTTSAGWEGQIGFNAVQDYKRGGSALYNFSNRSSLFNIYGKTGYVFQDGNNSMGVRWSVNKFKNRSAFGLRNYQGDELTGYINLIYESEMWNDEHTFRTGTSFLFDNFNELYNSLGFKRTEKVPGAFFEYTFKQAETFSIVAGLRGDYHNYYKTMITPRLHLRYSPGEDWVIRAAAGRGFRTSNIFSEYSSFLASSRSAVIQPVNNFGYGLEQEIAWNYGLNLLHYFNFGDNVSTISLDLYRTDFQQSTLADWDSHPQQVIFMTITNGAYSNTLQMELNTEFIDRLELRLAYRYVDSKIRINNIYTERPLNPRHRGLFNAAYATGKDTPDSPEMLYDLTVQWLSGKRIPSTGSNPAGFIFPGYSPSFAIVNTQITRSFSSWLDLYLGIENLFNFRQRDLIIDPFNPFGNYFDASLVWGPVHGRSVYAGFRYKL